MLAELATAIGCGMACLLLFDPVQTTGLNAAGMSQEALVMVFPAKSHGKPTNPFLPPPERAPEGASEASPQSGSGRSDPFRGSPDRQDSLVADEVGCGPNTSLARAELRKPVMAERLCQSRFVELDKEWLFVLYYVRGFNEFLEDRGAFMDPTGACSRAVEPRQSLSLIYEAIDKAVSGDVDILEDGRVKKMLEPFLDDWRRAPFILFELNVWKREGRLDATSVASRGMCGDPAFKRFWSKAIEYAERVPGDEGEIR